MAEIATTLGSLFNFMHVRDFLCGELGMDIALIEDIFRTSFSIPCMYDVCENIITLFKFFVVERLKHEKKVFYKFQTVFLVHIKQVGQMASMVPLPASEVQRSQLLSAEIWISLRCAIGFKSRVLSICCAVWETWTF